MDIREDDLTGEEVIQLLAEHLTHMQSIRPIESVHVLGLEALRSPDVTFWSAWVDDKLAGCGALKEIDAKTGEIKSMRTAKAHRRKGVASALLEHIIHEAKQRTYDVLKLETGARPEFVSARSLYERYGFEYIGPFANYREDPNSVFMMKWLTT